MSSTALPPPRPAGETGRSRRRWPWLVAALSLALVLVTTGLVVVVRDQAEARRELDALREQREGQQAAEAPASDDGSAQPGDGGDAPPQGDGPAQGGAPRRAMRPRAVTLRAKLLASKAGCRTCSTSSWGRPGCRTSTRRACADVLGEGGGESIDGTVEEQVAAIAPIVEDLADCASRTAWIPTSRPATSSSASWRRRSVRVPGRSGGSRQPCAATPRRHSEGHGPEGSAERAARGPGGRVLRPRHR